MKFRVGLAQVDCELGNIEKNLKKHIDFIKEAKKNNVELVVFPELSLTGYTLRDLVSEVALKCSSSEIEGLRKESLEGPDIIFGFVEESDEYKIYNSSCYLSKGEIIGCHRKIFLPTYGMFEEMKYFCKGTGLDIIETPFGKLGVEICEDTWHPIITETLVTKGAKLLVFQNASPMRINSDGNVTKENNYLISKFYSMIYGVYIIMVNRVGFENGINLWGGSALFAPGGEIIVEGEQFKEELIINEIDMDLVRNSQLSYPLLRDQDTDILFGKHLG